MLKLRLESDYKDYYDGAFDQGGAVLYRMGDRPLSLERSMKLLSKLGLPVPLCGPVRTVYTDVLHNWQRGMGMHRTDAYVVVAPGGYKQLLPLPVALASCPEEFCIEYVPETPEHPRCLGSSTLRFLFVGGRCFTFERSSADDWRSGCGDVTERLLSEEVTPPWRERVNDPLLVVDAVRSQVWSRTVAVAVSLTPFLANTPLAAHLSPQAVVEAIKRYMDTLSPRD